MESRPVIWLVGTECSPGREAEYNEWYNRLHMPTELEAPGIIRGTRYERIGSQFEYPRYLAIYELESEAAIEAIWKSEATARAAEQHFGRGLELGLSMRWMAHYRPIGP